MTDRELLEAAAKAAGIKALRDPHGVLRNCTGGGPAMNIFAAPPWNPLTDDGDALRLAVKLGVSVSTPDDGDQVTSATHWSLPLFYAEKAGADPFAATRRAIVRAAAALAVG